MADKLIKFYIQGPCEEALAQELSDLIAKEFGQQPDRIDGIDGNVEKNSISYEKVDPATIVATVAAVILAVPPAILSTMDLVDRLNKKKKLDQLKEWAEKQHTKYPGIKIQIEISNLPPEDLHNLNIGKMFDALNK